MIDNKNPSQDHRDRGKHLPLPSYLQIENASDLVQSFPPKFASEAFPILRSGDTLTTECGLENVDCVSSCRQSSRLPP